MRQVFKKNISRAVPSYCLTGQLDGFGQMKLRNNNQRWISIWLLFAVLIWWGCSTTHITLAIAYQDADSTNSGQFHGQYESAEQRRQAEVGSRLNQVLKNGTELERSRRWGEALNVYQQAIKQFPSDQSLLQRRAVARIHYDFERRYSDSSFLSSVQTTDVTTALETYSEILSKIQLYYVDPPDWADLCSYGLTSLEVALMSQEFRERYIPDATEQQIRRVILQTREQLGRYEVDNPHDADRVVRATAVWLKNSIDLPVQATVYEFICGAISALDPYSSYMSRDQFNETMSQIEGNFVGLGVELKTHDDHLEIVNVIPGGSADRGGVLPGDQITSVDGVRVIEIGGDRAADLLRGPELTYVNISLRRQASADADTDSQIALKLQRLRVEIPSIDATQMVDVQQGIGYVRINNFQKTTVRDFDQALWNLNQQGMKCLIVDLRGNPGGLLKASVDLADRFINTGVIVSTKGRNPIEDFTHHANPATTWRIPLVVLVDGQSASASEIFAAAIRDHKRGFIVGETTFGKGSVQGIFPLHSAGGVRLTTAKFFSPLGNPISDVGVRADEEVETETQQTLLKPEMFGGEDIGLSKAIQSARRIFPN